MQTTWIFFSPQFGTRDRNLSVRTAYWVRDIEVAIREISFFVA